MVCLRVLSGSTAGQEFVARRFPLVAGRGRQADVRIEGTGVWERHFRIEWERDQGLVLAPEGEAIVRVDGRRVQRERLRNGCVIEAGDVRLLFTLSPVLQVSPRWREGCVWAGLALLFVAELAIMRLLPP
ncbi:MAG: FHA domain-containing protein [Verrucomicrobia bacterium]|nr:MAG: FHA domain-containing protein [Verrucomicrobiota bacterium]